MKAWEDRLAGAGVTGPFGWRRLGGGGNNQVFELTAPGQRLLVKHYFRHPDDPRDRLQTELRFSQAVYPRVAGRIPRPLLAFPDDGLAVYEFVEGRALLPSEVTAERVREALTFVRDLNEGPPPDLPDASEACFSEAEHVGVVQRRLARLQREGGPELRPFLDDEMLPVWKAIQARLGTISSRPLEPSERLLSPSDFGYHNVLVRPGGELVFLDFEYAGWDDPAKLMCDFFCQPRVPVPAEYFPLVAQAFPAPARQRAERLVNLYRLKWVCIVLNPLLADGRERRTFAGDSDLSAARTLDRARVMLAVALEGNANC